ncbi:MAG: hypothetical protein Q8O88_04960 [bacterium]|nr:hypothetical protein [bacterium]
MAARDQVIKFNQQALYVGPATSTGGHYLDSAGVRLSEDNEGSGNLVKQLYRIQNCNYSWGVNRTNVYQFGELAAIDKVILETPTVNLSFSYLVANAYNESGLGFYTQGSLSALSGILNKTEDDRNYWLKIAPEGEDAVGNDKSDVNTFTIGFGNGFITSYSTQAAINSFPTCDIAVECLNMTFDTGTSGTIPAIFPDNGARVTGYRYTLPQASGSPGTGNLDISVLRPGDITMTILQREASDEGGLENATSEYSTAGVSINDARIQSYNISLGLAREPIQELGTKFAISRDITFPVSVSCSVDAIVTNLTTGSLSDMVNCDQAYDLIFNLRKPVCPGEAQPVIVRHVLKNSKLEGVSYTSDIGSNKRATLNFSSEIGSALQVNRGWFLSGISSHVAGF